jgi:hypothetical protein
MGTSGENAEAGPIYAQLISDELRDEQSRKASLEQRGLAVISTSGVLVSLLLALATVVKRTEDFNIHREGRIFLIFALVGFITAAAFGIATNTPRSYIAIANDDLRRMVSEELWHNAEAPALRRIAENRVETLAVARRLNNNKGRLLLLGILGQSIGVVFVAATVASLLLRD